MTDPELSDNYKRLYNAIFGDEYNEYAIDDDSVKSKQGFIEMATRLRSIIDDMDLDDEHDKSVDRRIAMGI